MEKLRINNIPIADFDVILGENSYKSLLQWPSLKSVQTNNWAEDDGIEVDLSAPRLSSRNFSLYFHGYGEDRYAEFISYLSNSAINDFWFPELGIKLSLRVDSNSLSKMQGNWQSFSINFVDDSPRMVFEPLLIDGTPTDYQIDGTDFADYGLIVLEGTDKSLKQLPKNKQRLTISLDSQDGAVYDSDGSVNTESTKATLKLLLRAKTIHECIRLYYTFLRDMTTPQSKELFRADKIESYECYYDSNSVSNFCLLHSGLWGIVFDLTINIIRYSIGDDEYIVDDSGLIMLLTDDGKYLKK